MPKRTSVTEEVSVWRSRHMPDRLILRVNKLARESGRTAEDIVAEALEIGLDYLVASEEYEREDS